MVVCPSEGRSPARGVRYDRRHPERSDLHRIMRENLPRLIASAEDLESGTSSLPKFVKDELQAYLDCGLLCRGFLRAKCESCGQGVLVAFSCKGRGFCPSCGARRMEDEAHHIVERVLPDEPVRQWVLSLPFQIRSRVAYDAEIFAAVTRIFIEEIFRHIEKNIPTEARGRPHCGAIAFLQRFGSTLNLNPHIHALALDGAYRELPPDGEGEDVGLEFHAIAAPTPAQVEEVSRRVARRIIRLLQRRGLADAEQIIPDDTPATPERARCSTPRPESFRSSPAFETGTSSPSTSEAAPDDPQKSAVSAPTPACLPREATRPHDAASFVIVCVPPLRRNR